MSSSLEESTLDVAVRFGARGDAPTGPEEEELDEEDELVADPTSRWSPPSVSERPGERTPLEVSLNNAAVGWRWLPRKGGTDPDAVFRPCPFEGLFLGLFLRMYSPWFSTKPKALPKEQ
jgi:hypothetical protein